MPIPIQGAKATLAQFISRQEDADYEGHSLKMLNRIVKALKQKVTEECVSIPWLGSRVRPTEVIAP